MSNSATDMLVSATIEFLRAYPPFDRMELDALQFLGEHAKLAYYPKGALILSLRRRRGAAAAHPAAR